MTTPTPTEQRDATRVQTRLEADVIQGETTVRAGRSRDLSLGGVYVFCSETFAPRSDCEVRLYLDGRDSGTSVLARGKVARVDEEGMAIQFRGIGIESYEQLRDLILFNADDAGQIHEEFERHADPESIDRSEAA